MGHRSPSKGKRGDDGYTCGVCGKSARAGVLLEWESGAQIAVWGCGAHPLSVHLAFLLSEVGAAEVTSTSRELSILGVQDGKVTKQAGLASLKMVSCQREGCPYNADVPVCSAPVRALIIAECNLMSAAEGFIDEVTKEDG